MPKDIKAYRVFIASPRGLEAERRKFREALRDYNEVDGYDRSIMYWPVGWEITLGGSGRPQSLINEDVEKCDFLLLVLWDRWGSRPATEGDPNPYTSGTEEEFAVAEKALNEPNQPMRNIIILFKSVDPRQLADPGEQLTKVLEFKEKLEREKKYLFETFDTIETFDLLLRKHLARWTRDDERGTGKGGSRPVSELPTETLRPASPEELNAEVLISKDGGISKQTVDEIRKAWELADKGKLTEAESLFAKTIIYFPSPETLNNFALFLTRIGRISQAEMMYLRGAELSEISGDLKNLAIQYSNLGNVYQIRGELDQAEAMYRKSLEIEEQLGRREGMASDYGNLGIVYKTRGELDKAEAMYRKALEINEQLGRREGMANQYGNLGIVYQIRGELDQAEAMYRKSLEIEEQLGRREGMASDYGNLGTVYQTRGELDQAEAMYLKSLEINEQLGCREGMANQYGNLGTVYQIRGELDKAEAMYRKSLEINEPLGRREGMANQYGNLGIVYEKRGQKEKAVEYWQKAKGLYGQIGATHMAERMQGWID